MRAATPRKQAMRTLLHAGRYLQDQYNATDFRNVMEQIALTWAGQIIATKYNEVFHEQL